VLLYHRSQSAGKLTHFMSKSNSPKSTLSPGTIASAEPTTIGGYVLAIAKALEYSGVDSSRILQAVGISQALTNDPMSRLPVATLTRLYRACVEVTCNPCFGLTVARFIHVSNLHALGYALAASTTLMEFCRRLERYFRLASQTGDIVIAVQGDEVSLQVRLQADISAESEDAFIGFVVLAMRQLYKADFKPLHVAFRHAAPPSGIRPYEVLFRSELSFSQEMPRLIFPRADLEQPLAGACSDLAQLNDNIATTYIARLDKNDVVTAVRQKIIEFLPSGGCSREEVAGVMCMSPTTLQAKLAQRNTNFHDLLDSIRKELALSYVKQLSLSITEITYLLGFSDTSNFTRAFKRWEGVSPSQFRSAAAATAPASA